MTTVKTTKVIIKGKVEKNTILVQELIVIFFIIKKFLKILRIKSKLVKCKINSLKIDQVMTLDMR